MKATIYCLLIALALRVAWTQSVNVPTSTIQFVDDGGRALIIKGKVADEFRAWLIIEAHNGKYWQENGYEPSYTHILCDYKPMARKLPGKDTWEIIFVSPIAENLP